MNLVDNVTVRRAVAEFAAQPDQRRALDVLRSCMYGELLFDVTGSDEPEDGSFRRGSRIQIRGGAGPGGGRALFAFTRQEEIAGLYPPGTRTQSMVTPATGALGLALQQGDAWLYIDPAGPTCALAAAHIDFALRNPNNEPLKTALAALHAGHTDRREVLQVLLAEGPMLLAADETTVPGKVTIRSTALADGSPALVGFTSAPEVVAFNVSDAFFALNTLEVLEKVRADGYSALVINPAGPSIAFSEAELEIGSGSTGGGM
ncbi:SseB family protein [Mycobacterium sp. MMS18-G62]